MFLSTLYKVHTITYFILGLVFGLIIFMAFYLISSSNIPIVYTRPIALTNHKSFISN